MKLYHRIKKKKSGTWTWVACVHEDRNRCFYCGKLGLKVVPAGDDDGQTTL